MNWLKHNLSPILSVLTSVFVGLILVLLLNQMQASRQIAENTNNIVHSQSQILSAIRDLATDTKLTAEKKTNIIICMLQVPQPERTTDTITGCRAQVEAGSSAQSSPDSSASAPVKPLMPTPPPASSPKASAASAPPPSVAAIPSPAPTPYPDFLGRLLNIIGIE